jgi:hypothetical protein
LLIAIVTLVSCSRPEALEIVQVGLFDTTTEEWEANSEFPGGGSQIVGSFTLSESPTHVPPTLGTTFGVAYEFTGPPHSCAEVVEEIRPPAPGIQDPSGRTFTEVTEVVELVPGDQRFAAYTFHEPWELVSGTWLFRLTCSNGASSQVEFTVGLR